MKSEQEKAFGVQTATITVPVRARNSLLYISHFCLRHEPETTRSHLAVFFTLSLKSCLNSLRFEINAFANYLHIDTDKDDWGIKGSQAQLATTNKQFKSLPHIIL